MFLGHYALGFGAKKMAPTASPGTFFLAAQFADLLWPDLVLLGIEEFSIEPGITAVTPLNFTRYPYSHSLAALVVWGALFALIYFFARGRQMRAAIVVGAQSGEEAVWLKKSLARVFLYLILEVAALSGVPMRPDEITRLMQVMDRTASVVTRESTGDGDDQPGDGTVTPAV